MCCIKSTITERSLQLRGGKTPKANGGIRGANAWFQSTPPRRQTALAPDLPRGLYRLDFSSIVELTRAQLNLTEAEIENLNAEYDYQALYFALQYATGLRR